MSNEDGQVPEKVAIQSLPDAARWLITHVETLLGNTPVNTEPEAHEVARELHAAGY